MTSARRVYRWTALAPLVLSLIACACDGGTASQPLANSAREGLASTTIEEVLALDPAEIDLATACLIADREVDPDLDSRACIERLDELAREFLADREPGESVEDTLRSLVEIASHAPISSDEIEYESRQSLLSQVLEQGRGNCLSLSALYLSIAERAGVELRGVMLPGHFKVRHEGPAGLYEIETTSGEITAGRDDSIARYFSERDRKCMRFGDGLSKRDTLASYLAETASRLRTTGRLARGLEYCQLSLSMRPDLAIAHVFIGDIQNDVDPKSGAGVSAYQRALEIRADDAYVWFKLGTAHMGTHECSLALDAYSKALALDADFAPAWLRLAEVQVCEGVFDDAIESCRAARRVNLELSHPQDAAVIVQLYGSNARFVAETYRTQSNIYRALTTKYSGQPPEGMTWGEALRLTERWSALSKLCLALAAPELIEPESGRWAFQSATDAISANPQLAVDPVVIELAEAAKAHFATY